MSHLKHGSLDGVGDDDHAHYLLADGTRALTGALDLGACNITNIGTAAGRNLVTDGTKLDGIETGATADQTGAEIKTAYEAEADTNAFTDAEQTKLAGIETAADVTDATNVAAAGAVMDSDFAATSGFMRKTSEGAYVAILANLAASTDPGSTDDSSAGYAVSSLWINVTLDKVWMCTDSTTSAATWALLGTAGA